jgi:hypothetical protein
MYYDVVEAKVLEHLVFTVRFADGLTGRVVILPSHLRGVFGPLADPARFRELRVTDGFVSWPDEIDLAPDGMYAAIRDHSEWILS